MKEPHIEPAGAQAATQPPGSLWRRVNGLLTGLRLGWEARTRTGFRSSVIGALVPKSKGARIGFALLLTTTAVVAIGASATADAATVVPCTPVGTWVVNVSIPVASENFVFLETFHADRTYAQTASFVAADGNPNKLGIWSPTPSLNNYEYAFSEFLFDASGTWIGWHRVHGHETLSADCQSLTGTWTIAVWDTANNQVSPVITASLSGSRLQYPPY